GRALRLRLLHLRLRIRLLVEHDLGHPRLELRRERLELFAVEVIADHAQLGESLDDERPEPVARVLRGRLLLDLRARPARREVLEEPLARLPELLELRVAERVEALDHRGVLGEQRHEVDAILGHIELAAAGADLRDEILVELAALGEDLGLSEELLARAADLL